MGTPFSFTNSKGVAWYLNTQEVTLKNGIKQKIYFFSKDVRTSTNLSELPAGYEVLETSRTAMPVLKRSVV